MAAWRRRIASSRISPGTTARPLPRMTSYSRGTSTRARNTARLARSLTRRWRRSSHPIRVEQGLTLEQQWAAREAGTVQYRPQLPRLIQVQHRMEYANPQAVRDARVRRALAHAMDKPAINESLFQGKGLTSDSLIYPT